MSFSGLKQVIYVDSNSKDGSAELASKMGVRVIELKGGQLTAARARNAGWQAASAPFVFFLDGDTILAPEFVTLAMAEFANPDVKVVWGHRREVFPQASVYNRVLDLDWVYKPGLSDFCGGDAIMRRADLEKTNGFNPDLIAGEEPDLCRRIRAQGGLIMHIDAAMTGHDLAMTSWRQYWRRALRAGHAYAEIGSLYKNTGDPLWNRTSRATSVRALIYLIMPILVALATVLTHSWLYLLLAGACLIALLARTAWKSRYKRASPGTLLLFGLHSHIQQIPIFFGQLHYWMNVKRRRRSELIEYKTIS